MLGCKRKQTATGEITLELPPRAEAPAPLAMGPEAGLRVGLPQGCFLYGRPLGAPVGEDALFFAPDEPRDELALVQPSTTRVGVVSLTGGVSRALGSLLPGHPAFFAAAGAGWLQLWVPPERPGEGWLLRDDGSGERVLQGEGLEITDLRCRSGYCAVLSTRAMRVAAAGATVLLGTGAVQGEGWKRADYLPEGAEPERPFVVASVSKGKVVATTVSAAGVRFFEAQGEKVTPGVLLPAPYGALDAILLRRPVAAVHGAQLVGDCARPRPLLSLRREGLPAVEIPVDAPPLALFMRPISRGALAVWLMPTHCGDRQRRVVYAALLDEDGGLESGPMAVTEATGVALATQGSRFDLWLRRQGRVVWLKGRCQGKG
ncbi:MAG: hypothetical protein RMJ98_14750 [Myxococcales bacterium]|nr:hypothetical protein [Polyangiaceae bacterium]MDW8250552.1 hypothetical protein [Myxococcales bacterium]